MAQLFRICSLRDTNETITYSFIIPPQAAATEGPQEILSRQFYYSGHAWRLILSKRDGVHLSPYLELCNAQPNLTCALDYTFTLINRESFTQNEKFQEKREFSSNNTRHGIRTFISLNDLYKRRGFTDRRRNEYIMQLTMKAPRTTFQCQILLTTGTREGDIDERRYDTNTFNYAHGEWQAVFCPNYGKGEAPHLIQLKRLNRSNLLTRLRYRIILGAASSNPNFQSHIIEELFGFTGDGEGFYFSEDYRDYLVQDNVLHISFQLHSGYNVSHLKLNANPQFKTSAACLDTDQQTWKVAAQTVGEYLYLNLYYSDLGNIPDQYLRYVRCNCSLIPLPKYEKAERLFVEENPIENYYAIQSAVDKGIRLPTRVQMRAIRDHYSQWTDPADGKYTVELGWEATELLIQPNYSVYDDISQRHLAQMRREVEALQSENTSLEKELHAYHLNLSSRCSSSADTRAHDRYSSLNMIGDEANPANPSNYNSPSISSMQLNEIGRSMTELNLSPPKSRSVSGGPLPNFPIANGVPTSTPQYAHSPKISSASYSVPSHNPYQYQ